MAFWLHSINLLTKSLCTCQSSVAVMLYLNMQTFDSKNRCQRKPGKWDGNHSLTGPHAILLTIYVA